MIKGNLFELKGKERMKALKERVFFVLKTWEVYAIFIMFGYSIFLIRILIKQQELFGSLG